MEKEKIKAALIAVIIAFCVVSVGWGILSYVIGSIGNSGVSESGISNTTSGGNSVRNIGGMFVIIIVAVAILLTLGYFASSVERYKTLGKAVDFLITSAYYFAYGLLAIAVVAIPSYLVYLLYNYMVLDGHAIDIIPTLQLTGIIIIAFFVIAGIGYIFKKKIIDKFMKIKQEIEYEENIEELPKVN